MLEKIFTFYNRTLKEKNSIQSSNTNKVPTLTLQASIALSSLHQLGTLQ